ncbi:MAG: ABC transporter ATP-binding protein [Alphaproteobacteria bacterium]
MNYLWPRKSTLMIAVFFMAFSAAMTAAVAMLMQPVLDDVLYGGREDLILLVSLALSATFAARGITTYIHTILMNSIGHTVVAEIQASLFAKFMHMDMAFFHDNPSGTLLSRVVNDVNVMRTAVTSTLTGFGKSFFTLIFLIMVMFSNDWKLTLAAFVVFPLLTIFVVYIGKRLRKISKSIQSELGGLSDLLSQAFQGIRLIKSYRMERMQVTKITDAINRVRDLNIKAVKVSTLSTPVNEILVGLIMGAIIAYGGYEVLAGRTTPGQLAAFLSAFILAYEPMKKLARLNNTLQMGLGATERVFDMLDKDPDINNSPNAIDLGTEVPNIEFKDVVFSYEGTDKKALNNISLNIEAGKVTALVGTSGGGKSTVMNLIPRFYDIHSGNISINNHDISDLTIESLRNSIALVSQDIMIFNESVIENIRYGKPDATDDEVFIAARDAAAHDFIEGFDDGYQTIVGENGVKLSGGQKQRISIARAILRDAPILLLDEATSALDNESEKLVQTALERLEKGRTTLVIAHRLTTVQDADHIIVLDRGCVAEQGTHNDLMKRNGLYANMYETGLK